MEAIRRVPPPALARARRLAREAIEDSSEFALSYEGTRFSLHVGGGASSWHSMYGQWADGAEVYEVVMLECLTRLLRQTERPAFMDVGAFMGHYACYAAALLNDQEETYAVESNPEYYACILRSIRLNGFSKLKPFNAVLSDRIEDAAIEGLAVRLFDASGTLHQTVTLDELCQRAQINPKVVKIDVHGSEGKVLMGMQEMMQRSVEYVLLELHSRELVREHSGHIGWSDILSLLSRLGFHVFHVAGHRYRGSDELRRAVQEGIAYRRLDGQSADLLLFDRPNDVLLLCSRTPDIAAVLGPSVTDPGPIWHGF